METHLYLLEHVIVLADWAVGMVSGEGACAVLEVSRWTTCDAPSYPMRGAAVSTGTVPFSVKILRCTPPEVDNGQRGITSFSNFNQEAPPQHYYYRTRVQKGALLLCEMVP